MIIKAHIYILIASILVAGSFIASAKLAVLIDPFSLIFLRFIISIIVLAPFILRKKDYVSKIKHSFFRALIISLFYSSFFILMFKALKTTSALNTATLYTLVPLLTAVLYMLFFKEKITIKQYFIYFMGIVGTCGVIFKGDINLLLSFTLNNGDYIFLAAIVFMAFYSISMKLFYKNDDTLVLVFCTLLGGAIWTGLSVLFLDIPLEWNLIQNEYILYILYISIAATLFTTFFYQKATILIGPKSVMSYIYLNPALVVFLSFLYEQKVISIEVFISIFVSALATIVLQFSLNKQR
ncbi:MAG: DMT family transporter [Campylobacteraceae bacterium]|nr:DMT family transporter [Campylobacteraceae bacterium]